MQLTETVFLLLVRLSQRLYSKAGEEETERPCVCSKTHWRFWTLTLAIGCTTGEKNEQVHFMSMERWQPCIGRARNRCTCVSWASSWTEPEATIETSPAASFFAWSRTSGLHSYRINHWGRSRFNLQAIGVTRRLNGPSFHFRSRVLLAASISVSTAADRLTERSSRDKRRVDKEIPSLWKTGCNGGTLQRQCCF